MANIYTKDDTTLSNKVFFLNGNNLTHVLNIDGKVNPIPSLTLMANVNKRVTKLSTEVQDLNNNDVINQGEILRTLTQSKGQISYTASKIADGDFETDALSQSKIKGLVQDLGNISSEYLLSSDFKQTLSSSFRFDDVNKDFRYDSEAKQFVLDVCGNKMTIELSSVMSSKIIDHVRVVGEGDDKRIRIYFDSTELDFVDIRIKDLTQIYKPGDGININGDLSISINNKVAKKEYVDSAIQNLDSTISNSSNGIIDTIIQKDGKLESFTRRSIISSDFDFKDRGETYHHSLPVNYIAGLDDRLSTLEDTDWRSLKFNGHIENADFFSRQNYLSDVFNNGGIQDFSTLYNGSFIEINFDDGVLSAKTLSDDTVYENGDYLIIHNHDSAKRTMTPSEIVVGKTAFLIRGGTTKADVVSALLAAKRYTDEVSSKLSVDYTKKANDAENNAENYTDVSISALSCDEQIFGADKTISSWVQENGKVTITSAYIQIDENHVNNLCSDLSTLYNTINSVSSDLDSKLVVEVAARTAADDAISSQLSDYVKNNETSVRIGDSSTASELCSIVIGFNSQSSALAIAEGYRVFAEQYSVALGKDTRCETQHSIAIGEGTKVFKNSGGNQIAIGSYAETSASYACQIGRGRNTETSSLQFLNTQIVDSNGKIPNKSLELNSQTGLISSDGNGNFAPINVDDNSISVINGQLSARGRVYTAGNGLKEDDGKFSISDSYLSSNALDSVSSNWDSAWSRISAAENGLSTDLKELAYKGVSDLKTLSSVYIKDETLEGTEGDYNNLSIIKLPLSSYELSVVDGTLSNNTLYIVDSDYLDMYGMQICALTMSDTEPKYEGIATTKPYVDEIKNTIVQYATQLSSEFNSTTPDFPRIANILSAMCVKLNEI